MKNVDYAVYFVQGAFWCTFAIGRYMQRSRGKEKSDSVSVGQKPKDELTAPFSRTLLLIHALAFAAMYLGLGNAVVRHRVPHWFSGQRIAGAIVIESGGILAAWAVYHFRSWRVRAKLEQGHELVTTGPFRLLRHPIYAGLNLFALGTAIWVPTPLLWLSLILMIVGGDLRARAEEKVLNRAFGNVYCEYCTHARRFVPGIY